MRTLVENAGNPVSRLTILKAVWGDQRTGRSPYVRLAVRAIRRQIEIDPNKPAHVLTERGVGYRLNIGD